MYCIIVPVPLCSWPGPTISHLQPVPDSGRVITAFQTSHPPCYPGARCYEIKRAHKGWDERPAWARGGWWTCFNSYIWQDDQCVNNQSSPYLSKTAWCSPRLSGLANDLNLMSLFFIVGGAGVGSQACQDLFPVFLFLSDWWCQTDYQSGQWSAPARLQH